MANLYTTTISLPRELAQRARKLSQAESRTMSELFREAFRFYEESRRFRPASLRTGAARWAGLRRSLKRVSAVGARRNLAAWVARDRRAH